MMVRFLALAWLLLLAGCTSLDDVSSDTVVHDASVAKLSAADMKDIDIDGDLLEREIRHLASDAFAGRLPGSPGGKRTEDYLEKRFRELGLSPGNGNSYRHQTPLVSITSVTSPLSVGAKEWRPVADFVAWTLQTREAIDIAELPLVFVGYGIHAPQIGWDDYAGVDVRGKVVVMLINDPGFLSEDPTLFRGKAMTYYGRWVYKFEEAARQGAAGALIIHDTEPASYPWAVVRNSWTGPQLHLQPEDGNRLRCRMEGWVHKRVGEWLFSQAGLLLEEVTRLALQPGFRGFDMGLSVSLRMRNGLRNLTSDNIVGLLPGTEHPDETVVIMAHWDHLGQNQALSGDNIFNGALDNATGVGGLLALAKAITSAGPLPRSVLFVAATAEEQGLLGSAWLATNPIVPTRDQVAVINMDGLNIFGPTKDIEVVGHGFSELDYYLEAAAEARGRIVSPESNPERGSYFRSDHFSLAKVGVPGLYTRTGSMHLEHGKEWLDQQVRKYVAERYHRPEDQYEDWWNLDGARQDLELLFDVALQLATTRDFPSWALDSEFRLIREQDGR